MFQPLAQLLVAYRRHFENRLHNSQEYYIILINVCFPWITVALLLPMSGDWSSRLEVWLSIAIYLLFWGATFLTRRERERERERESKLRLWIVPVTTLTWTEYLWLLINDQIFTSIAGLCSSTSINNNDNENSSNNDDGGGGGGYNNNHHKKMLFLCRYSTLGGGGGREGGL